ncbi:hypothetical protein SAMN02746089_01440 [Caldanaerobius fijiensis DSM 17918]|uniref:Uncharacterized protein n=1 Tax=Caldanaerobius fijiensis DSM 17918 TaxID=1121256 RepID=A0A1M4ZLA4_9THEO|nr:hypothetical protein SAMN02746089_01440 [Caldanaerobius fijiensis DSM 17918]
MNNHFRNFLVKLLWTGKPTSKGVRFLLLIVEALSFRGREKSQQISEKDVQKAIEAIQQIRKRRNLIIMLT